MRVDQTRHHRLAAGVDAAPGRRGRRAGGDRRDLAAADHDRAPLDDSTGAVDDTSVRDRQILSARSRGAQRDETAEPEFRVHACSPEDCRECKQPSARYATPSRGARGDCDVAPARRRGGVSKSSDACPHRTGRMLPKKGTRVRHKRILVGLAVVALAGCGGPQGPTGPRGPTEVGVLTLAPRSISIVEELPGRTVAYRVAEVRPQVSGIVQKRMFDEGGEVKSGEQLYQIDAATYTAALRSAEAALQRAEVNRDKAALLRDRYAPLQHGRPRQQAGLRRRGSRLQCGGSRRRGRQGTGRNRANQRRLLPGALADRRTHRPFARDRGRARDVAAGVTARDRSAARPDLRRHHAVERRDAEAAARLRER